MPQIQPIDFGAVEELKNIAVGGPYEGVVEKITYKEASKPGKFPQLSVEIIGTGGEIDGEKTWQNLSFSPKALGMPLEKNGMKAFFGVFGVEFDRPWPDEGDIDEDSGLVLDPDLSGVPVMFMVTDTSSPEYPKSSQTTILEAIDETPAPVKAKPTKPRLPTKAAAAPEVDDQNGAEEDEDEETEEAAPPPPKPSFRPASARSAARPAAKRTLR